LALGWEYEKVRTLRSPIVSVHDSAPVLDQTLFESQFDLMQAIKIELGVQPARELHDQSVLGQSHFFFANVKHIRR
jgi:hypothetical protein